MIPYPCRRANEFSLKNVFALDTEAMRPQMINSRAITRTAAGQSSAITAPTKSPCRQIKTAGVRFVQESSEANLLCVRRGSNPQHSAPEADALSN